MPIKTILTYLPNATVAPSVLAVAGKIAGPAGAHVIGLHLVSEVMTYSEFPLEVSQEVLERFRKASQSALTATKVVFEAAAARHTTGYEWRDFTAPYVKGEQIICDMARGVDLVICAKPAGNDSDLWSNFAQIALMHGGRPVLVIPFPPPSGRVGDRIIIAWNNTREAARAVFDSLDLIRDASMIRVVTFIDDEDRRGWAEMSSSNLVAALRRHSVSATCEVNYASGSDTGQALMSRLMEDGCDLLVMGGYGHSRAREFIFGGVSRDILRETTVPTLLSH